MPKRRNLTAVGWLVALFMYSVQAWVLIEFLVKHTGNNLYWFWSVFHLFFVFGVIVVACDLNGCARKDEKVSKVWCIWLIYIITFTTSVGLIFYKVVEKLDQSHWLSPNVLKSVLCITPALLVLVPQLTTSRSHRKSVLSLSVFAALNIFDGIEMLEIVLMQKERMDLKLPSTLETAIVVSACISFLATSFGLTRNNKRGKIVIIEDEDTVSESVPCTLLEILFTNVSFLILRIIVWAYCGYEASIFIAKNIISLGIGIVEFGVVGYC